MLTIPHPRMHERKFVLLPIYEINPFWTHPLLKKNLNIYLKKIIIKLFIRFNKKTLILQQSKITKHKRMEFHGKGNCRRLY